MTLQASMEPEKLQKLQRQYDAWQQRVQRIQDPKRKNAHDIEVLEQQNQTRMLQNELYKQQELAEAEKTLTVNAYLDQREREFIMAKKQKEREDLAWSAQYCGVENTREYDITHPDNSQPIRKDQVDQYGNVAINPAIGVSSGQWFRGEDLQGAQRRILQQKQFNHDVQQKMQEDQARRDQERQDRLDEENRRLRVNQYLDDQERQQQQQRKEQCQQVAQENMCAAENARRARELFKQQELDEEMKAIEEFHNTRLMTGTACEMKSTKPIVNSEYKGLTKEQKRQYERDQDEQRLSDRQRKEQSYAQRINDDHHLLDINRELMLREQRQKEQMKQQAMEIAEENRRGAIMHQTKKTTIKRDIGENQIDDYFHNKFGKSAR